MHVWWSNQEVIGYCQMPWFLLLAYESIWKLRWHNLLMGLKTLKPIWCETALLTYRNMLHEVTKSNPLYFVKAFDPDQAHKYQHDNKSLQLVENCGTSLCNFYWFLIQCENNSTILQVTSGKLRLNHHCGLKLANNPAGWIHLEDWMKAKNAVAKENSKFDRSRRLLEEP